MTDLTALRPAMPEADALVLARRHAPLLRLDLRDPFRPDVVGVTRLAVGETSPSCHHVPPAPEGSAFVLEYAIWWDGDIQHLYELEHVWICFDATEQPLATFASAHGRLLDMAGAEHREGRPVLFCEPGKHAHAPTLEGILAHREGLDRACTSGQRLTGILVQDKFRAELSALSPYDQYLGREYLRSLCFQPTYDYGVTVDLADLVYLSWSELRAEIPRFLRSQLEDLRRRRRGLKAVFLDSGDTLIDEESQIWDPEREGIVLQANAIPGADALMQGLAARGVPVALVADGRDESFRRVHGALGYWDMFEVKAISETSGICKPDPRMYLEAMRKLGLRQTDAAGIVMMGNNIKRDIRGANALGLTSVWLDWNTRYDRTPDSDLDRADHILRDPQALLDLVDRLTEESGWDA